MTEMNNEARRVTVEFAADLLGVSVTSLMFKAFYDHETQTVPEWVVARPKSADTKAQR